ncbi:hypothetical protein [Thermosynechococcus sp.]|uniref:hypothetical protein n=1 Tax=Thermosynechococcus sp. TaxID=2814275 RepID=UPI00391AAC13
MLKILQVAGLSSLTSFAVLSFADAAAAQLNVNINLGGSRQPVYVVPSSPSQPVYGVPTPQTQPVYVVQPGAPASPRSRHYRKKHHRHQPQVVIPTNPNGVLIAF